MKTVGIELTSIRNFKDVIQIDLFGSKVVIPRSYGIVKLSIASVLCENDSKITIFFVSLKKLL